jgi:hypothetical protein
LEYYNDGFTIYGYNSDNHAQFAMALYTAPGSGDPQPPEPEPTLVDVYVVDQVYGSQTEIKLWAWGADGNNAPSWDERPAMEYLGNDAVADKEAEQGGPFNDLPYYKYRLNVDAYGDGLLFTSPNGQTNNCAMTEEQKEAGLVVFYLYNNGSGASAGDAEIWKLDSHTEADCANPETYHYVGILNNGTYDREVGEALGHDWGEWTVTTEATTEAAGVETRVCKNDASHTETREIEKLPKAPVYIFVGDPTIDEDGWFTGAVEHDPETTKPAYAVVRVSMYMPNGDIVTCFSLVRADETFKVQFPKSMLGDALAYAAQVMAEVENPASADAVFYGQGVNWMN